MLHQPQAKGVSQQSPLPISPRELVVMLAMIQALGALAIDSMLPALGDIARDLHLHDPNHRQFVVGLNLLGQGIGSLIPGMLADRYGRRPVLLGALTCYVAMTVASALVHDFTVLVVIRVLQGIFCAGLPVVPAAIIRDRFEGDRMARLQSMIAVIFMFVPMVAPSIGQFILLFAGWRWIFGFMALGGTAVSLWVYFRLPETLASEHRQLIHPRSIAANMAATLSNRMAIGYVLASTLIMGVMWGWVQESEQLVAEHFGAGRNFPLIFGLMALAMAVGNFANARIVERFGARRVSHCALVAYIAVSCAQVWLAHLPHQSLWQFVPVMSINIALMGFMGANFASISLQPFARIAGAASSVQFFVRVVAGALLGAAVGQAYDHSARPLADSLLVAGVCSLVLVLVSEKGRLFHAKAPVLQPV